MARYQYSFATKIIFSEPIFSHHYVLHCTPIDSVTQKNITNRCVLMPKDTKSYGVDSFGNTLISGYLDDPHNYFSFLSEGEVEILGKRIPEKLNPVFLYHSRLAEPVFSITPLCETLKRDENQNIHQTILKISELINLQLVYASDSTTIHTPAHLALEMGKGVCQDFAHLMLSLCRCRGIPARYVTGFMDGEGYTHAWIEFYADGMWHGFDPTHHRIAETGYIKVAHGRDFSDCPVEKGVFTGTVQQNMEISLKVEQVQE